jgi:ribonuclease HI
LDSSKWELEQTQGKSRKEDQKTINLLSGGVVDARIKGKLINVIANTPLEYRFHSVLYSEEEINKLNIKNKKLLKRMMGISIRCPTSLLKMEVKGGGMGWRDLWDIYKEINIGDLGDVLNFQDKESLYYKTTKQRMKDVSRTENIAIGKKNMITNEVYNKYWIARALRLTQKEKIEVIENKNNVKEYVSPTYLEDIRVELGELERDEREWEELQEINIDVNRIFENNKLLEKKEIDKIIKEKGSEGKNISKKQWGILKKVMEDNNQIREEIEELVARKIRVSDFKKDKDEAIEAFEENWKIRKMKEIHGDGSCKEKRAGFGVWCEKDKERKRSYRVWGTQTAYNGELQGAIGCVNKIPPNTAGIIRIDNNAVIGIGSKIIKGEYIPWKKQPEPELIRMLQERIRWKETIENCDICFIKVKGHAGVKGNEKADHLAKLGVESEDTYIGNMDINEYSNEVSIIKEDKIICGRYRKEFKEQHRKTNKKIAKEDKNEQWRRMQGVECIEDVSNGFMKDRRIKKGEAIMVIKARTDLLPHAHQLYIRKIENVPSPYCPWCGHIIENTEHIMLDCAKYESKRIEIWDKVIEIISENDKNMNNRKKMREDIPKWFIKEENRDKISIFNELEKFDKLAGMLGYIPKQVQEVVLMYTKKDNNKKRFRRRIKKTLIKIHRTIIRGAHNIWIERNKKWDEKVNSKEGMAWIQVETIIAIREPPTRQALNLNNIFENESRMEVIEEI